jgi:hypothetical protein
MGLEHPLAPHPISTDKAAMAQITSRKQLERWLKGKPLEWGPVIAARAALRVLPYMFMESAPDEWVKTHSLIVFRTMFISWAACNFPAHDMHQAANRVVPAAGAAAHSAGSLSKAAFSNHADNSLKMAKFARAAEVLNLPNELDTAAKAANAVDAASGWANISHDCDWLASEGDPASASRSLTRVALRLASEPKGWSEAWGFAIERLNALDQGYSLWINWYNDRIQGVDTAFNIHGDIFGTEEKAILTRLANATNEDFWGKGATYVNTTLKGWIDEAEERGNSEPIGEPLQDSDALAYGVNTAGKLDRLPATDQQHLRDTPDQQRIYRDVREAALELHGEGQRLGARLEKALDRFLASLPEKFADAECYSVWRDGNTLRRIHLAHRAVSGGRDYDDKRLDAAMAEMLGDVLDRYNLFAFGDDGLRAKDEAAIPPQERAKAEDEAEKAAPLIDALLNAPEIMTDIVRDDIVADQADQALPKGDPYEDQALVQSNKSMRNRIAGLLSGVGGYVIKIGKEFAKGAVAYAGGAAVSDAAGASSIYKGLAKFATDNITALTAYAQTAYANVSLQWLWDALSKWDELSKLSGLS